MYLLHYHSATLLHNWAICMHYLRNSLTWLYCTECIKTLRASNVNIWCAITCTVLLQFSLILPGPAPGDVAIILVVYLTNTRYESNSWTLLVELVSDEFHRIPPMIRHYCLCNGSVTSGNKPLPWANVDPDLSLIDLIRLQRINTYFPFEVQIILEFYLTKMIRSSVHMTKLWTNGPTDSTKLEDVSISVFPCICTK